MLRDATRVRANLNGRLLDRYLAHYAAEWAKEPAPPVADISPVEPTKPKVSANVDFPSADSIPRVSIMNPEPTGPVLPGVAAAAVANPNPPGTVSATPPPRRPRKQTAAPAAPPPAQPAGPVGAATGAPVVPPVQLVPFPPPEANAGLATRAQ
jgi:hypothetical protein